MASFHISTGVLSKSTKRVMVAFLSLEKSVVCWPNAAEKKPFGTLFKNPMDFRMSSA